MDSSVSPKDEIWFLPVCHHVSKAVYLFFLDRGTTKGKGGGEEEGEEEEEDT